MGFCRRCGEIVNAERCSKCGGTARESTTKILFGEKVGDKWSQRYLVRSSSPTNSNNKLPSNASNDANAKAHTTSLSVPQAQARPPPTPSKLAHSFLQQSESEDAELSAVFGSVLSPRDHWQCSSCSVKFRQEEVIYPHPEAKSDPAKGELYFCRKCFGERFAIGSCKKCKLAVLSDAKFIKHENHVWHEPCYVCSYCPNLSRSSVVIDFAARPSCEDCFDSFAYKSAGILPSPHLSQTEWKPLEAPPPPNKWGRPSMTTASGTTSVWSSKVGTKRADAKSEGEKTTAWRVKQERENSPLVQTYDELGDKMKRLGLSTNSTSTTSRPLPSPAAVDPSPVKVATPSSSRTSSSANKSAPASAPVSSPVPLRSVLKPVQQPFTSSLGSPKKLPPPSTSARAITPLDSKVPPASSKPSPINDQENCPACSLPLGYGQFVELPSGTILHVDCFACDGCHKPISGKYVNAEDKAYHKACAPAPKRYRAIVTSLNETASTSPTSPDSPKANPLTAELEPDEPTCEACSGLLGYGLSVTIPKSGKSFHRDCFTCATCALPFDKGFVENSGLAYHEKCVPVTAIVPNNTANRSEGMPSSPSRTSRPPRLPTLPSFPPKHSTPAPPSPASLPPRSLFSTRTRPPSNLGGLLICTGCSVRATEKEMVPGPGGRRWHRKCLVCGTCKRELDSEVRGGETGILRCEACRKLEARRSYRNPTQGSATAF
ncbi:uncharacterized protein JCM6883_002560 [Sporobolomyces salmoneus]|uniref:uncharacterized protein n=1 Tax=Sporobolomyces salmoneus TaxID=183962 RepID=UPI00317B29FE